MGKTYKDSKRYISEEQVRSRKMPVYTKKKAGRQQDVDDDIDLYDSYDDSYDMYDRVTDMQYATEYYKE